jgi:hypothetical protein
MLIRHALPLSIAALTLAFASGCTVYERPAATQATMIPASEPDMGPPPQGNDQVWIEKQRRWDGQGYVIEHGHYERRPHRGAQYVRGHWEMRRSHRVWVESHWE